MIMEWTDADKALVGKIAAEMYVQLLKIHIENCPHHQAYILMKAKVMWFLIGAFLLSGGTSGVAVGILIKIMGKIADGSVVL